MFRRIIIVFTILVVVISEARNNCKCWKDFEVTANSFGDIYCQDKKNRTFGCNEEEPPVCECTLKGETIVLDLGESNCQSIDPNSGSWCNNRKDWITYYEKHPEYLVVD